MIKARKMERKLFIYIVNRMLATKFFRYAQKLARHFYHVKFPYGNLHI